MSDQFADFSKPGEQGALPEGFVPWRWAVTYTVHPTLLSPVQHGREYRFVVSVLRKIAKPEDPGYAELYNRAFEIAKRRSAQLKCSEPDSLLSTRIMTQGWFTHANTNLARAFVTMSAVYLNKDGTPPQGLPEPAAEEFAAPGGMTPDNYALPPAEKERRVYELYSYGDVRDPAVPDANIFTMSYGEYVPSSDGTDYAPFVQRAEDLAHFHFSIHSQAPDSALRIVRREWFCATNPDIAVVHLYIQT